jgi:hypothetical protein
MSEMCLSVFADASRNCYRYVNQPNQITLLTQRQEIDGKLSFATDAWTSPNHKAYVAITAHYEKDGTSKVLLLDLVEVPKSHTGVNLATAFFEVLEAFGIQDKVSSNKRFQVCPD